MLLQRYRWIEDAITLAGLIGIQLMSAPNNHDETFCLLRKDKNLNQIFGGRTRIRTLDPLIKSQLLYQLSYTPEITANVTTPSMYQGTANMSRAGKQNFPARSSYSAAPSAAFMASGLPR